MIIAVTRAESRAAQPRRGTNTLLQTGQILLAGVFAVAALPKLAGAHSAVQMFGQIRERQWLRYLVGTAELTGAVGLLIPGGPRWPPGWPPTWPARPSSTPRVLHSAAVALTMPLCAVLALLTSCRWEQPPNLTAAIRR